RALLDDDATRALARLDTRRVRYVVATALPPAALPRYLAALDDSRPPERVLAGALIERLLRDDGQGIAGLRELASSADGRAKLFERIPGARLEGKAPPGSEVTATVPLVATALTDEHLRRFVHRLSVRAGADGAFVLALPYPTEPDPQDATMV